MSLYPGVLFAGNEQHAWGVEVPDVPSGFSASETMSEALELHFEGLVADGDPLPQLQVVDAHAANPEYAGGVWAPLDFDVTLSLGKSMRFNATLPEYLSSCIEDCVRSQPDQKGHSGFLVRAVFRALQQS